MDRGGQGVTPVVVDASALIAWLPNDGPATAAQVEAAIARRADSPLIGPVLLRARGAELLTADTALAHAARRAGVAVRGD
jgi:predicted nucleic acid-binding protein